MEVIYPTPMPLSFYCKMATQLLFDIPQKATVSAKCLGFFFVFLTELLYVVRGRQLDFREGKLSLICLMSSIAVVCVSSVIHCSPAPLKDCSGASSQLWRQTEALQGAEWLQSPNHHHQQSHRVHEFRWTHAVIVNKDIYFHYIQHHNDAWNCIY